MTTTQKRLEVKVADLQKRCEGLMRDKILLSGRVAMMQGVIESYKTESEVMKGHLVSGGEQKMGFLWEKAKSFNVSPTKLLKYPIGASIKEEESNTHAI
jgi:hypothetical protein